MQMAVECWEFCGEEFTVTAPDRSDTKLVDGVEVACSNCGGRYIFTVDGDGEPSLDSTDQNTLGENIDQP